MIPICTIRFTGVLGGGGDPPALMQTVARASHDVSKSQL